MRRAEINPDEAGGGEMIGYLAVDHEAGDGGRAAVLPMHEGGGQDDNVRDRTERLRRVWLCGDCCARLPRWRLPAPTGSAPRRGSASSSTTAAAVRELAAAGYDVLTEQPGVDIERVAVVGFCFGGVVALELARSGVPLRAVIGFHPGFTAFPDTASASISASVLMMCGADDPVVSAEDRRRFEDEMHEAHVADWRLEVYGGIGHSFTNLSIASRGLPGLFRVRRARRQALVGVDACPARGGFRLTPRRTLQSTLGGGACTEPMRRSGWGN